jgi:hypothetical protein
MEKTPVSPPLRRRDQWLDWALVARLLSELRQKMVIFNHTK